MCELFLKQTTNRVEERCRSLAEKAAPRCIPKERATAPERHTMPSEARSPRLAILIDADNASAKIADGLLEEIAEIGQASVCVGKKPENISLT